MRHHIIPDFVIEKHADVSKKKKGGKLVVSRLVQFKSASFLVFLK